MRREEYLEMRAKYAPTKPRLIFICESPPEGDRYFYCDTGLVTEYLFRAMMHDVLKITPRRKIDGLQAFQGAGYLLLDATYNPVNKKSRSARNRIIADGFPLLMEDLLIVNPEKSIPLVLIKENVCRLLDARLTELHFSVINRGNVVYFPSTGQQGKFRKQIKEVFEPHPELMP